MYVVVTLQGIDVDDEEESEKDLKLTFEDYDEKEIEIMLKQIHRERFENFSIIPFNFVLPVCCFD